MSHKAVNWALEQRHLKPGPWVVLIQLGDRHNKDTKQVSPCQLTIADDCNMSRATVNRRLEELEGLGLLVRVPRQHPVTQKKLVTHYILGLDFKNPPEVEHAVSQVETRQKIAAAEAHVSKCNMDAKSQTETRKRRGKNKNMGEGRVSNCNTETVSQNPQEPCLKNGENHVSNRDINQVIKPVIEPCAASASHSSDLIFDDFCELFLEVFPRTGNRDLTIAELSKLIDAGEDPEHLIAAAKAYADEQEGNKAQYIAMSENWLRGMRWKTYPKPQSETEKREIILAGRAQAIKAKQSWVVGAISAHQAGELVQMGLVTAKDCKAAGLDL